MLLLLDVVGVLPHVMAITAMYLLWRGLRAAGVEVRAGVLIPLALLILSPALITPGVLLQAFFYQFVPANIVRLWLPVFLGVLVGLTILRALQGAGLGLNKALWFGVGAGMALLAAFGAHVALNAYIVASHALG